MDEEGERRERRMIHTFFGGDGTDLTGLGSYMFCGVMGTADGVTSGVGSFMLEGRRRMTIVTNLSRV